MMADNMEILVNKEFNRVRLDGVQLSQVLMQNCSFRACAVDFAFDAGRFTDPQDRSIFEKCTLVNCIQYSSYFGPSIIKECNIRDLTSPEQHLSISGAFFDRVTLSGRWNTIQLLPLSTAGVQPETDLAFLSENVQCYRHVDWAIDICDLVADEFVSLSIPVDLVRYCPKSQGVIRRQNWLSSRKRFRDLTVDTWFRMLDADFDMFPDSDGAVVAVPINHRNRDCFIAAMDRLRAAGIMDRV